MTIMDIPWVDQGDGRDAFNEENVGDGAVAARLNIVAERLAKRHQISIVEARNRLWNQGDFYPRLVTVEAELGLK